MSKENAFEAHCCNHCDEANIQLGNVKISFITSSEQDYLNVFLRRNCLNPQRVWEKY